MANPLTYGQQQAEKNLRYWQGVTGKMREPSFMASQEEKEAYAAQQVRGGEAPTYMLPEAYGGMPTGTTRRAIRAQQAWAAQQEYIAGLAEQQRQAAEEQRQINAEIRAQNLYDLDRRSKQIDLEVKEKTAAIELGNFANAQEQASGALDIIASEEDSPLGLARAQSRIQKEFPLAFGSEQVQKVLYYKGKNAEAIGAAMTAQSGELEKLQNRYIEDMQKLLETGVTEEQLPEYYDPNSPVGIIQFDPRKVAARIGISRAQEKAETKTTKEETPKQKIGLDLQQAYGELNSALMGGEDTATAQSKVAGLRARYEATTGEPAPEVFPQPKTKQEYDRLPAGTAYIGKDGKRKIKQ